MTIEWKPRKGKRRTWKRRGTRIALGAASVVCAWLLLLTGVAGSAATLAQLSLPNTTASSPPAGVTRSGIYLTAPVTLDGVTLFTIADDANASSSQLPLQDRLADIQTDLGQVLATTGTSRDAPTEYDPRTLRIHVKLRSDLASLEAVDAKHQDPLPILTVTTADAGFNRVSVADLSTEWQGVLQSALIRALELRQPAMERRSAQSVVRIALVLAMITLGMWATITVLRRRTEKLADTIAQRERAADDALKTAAAGKPENASQGRRNFLARALRAQQPAQQVQLYRAIMETGVWLLLVMWLAALVWAFSLFPQTTPLSQAFLHATTVIVVAIVVTGLLNRLIDVVIARIASATRFRSIGRSEDSARLLLRIPTIASAIRGFKAFLLVFVAALAVLGQIGIPIASVVTIGGLAAIALSFAAQSFVRDFVMGFLVLFEDHYVVGDYVGINAFSGLVERLTLRMVQIRDVSGDLITIPHSSVTSVINMSREWSRVDYRVPVDPAADVPKAIALVRGAIEGLAAERAWRDAFREPIEWIGIDELSKDWIVVRASVKTAPLRQFELRREINARVEAAFKSSDIAYGAQIPGVVT
jgi:small conductance mechanosensitive channel